MHDENKHDDLLAYGRKEFQRLPIKIGFPEPMKIQLARQGFYRLH